MMFYISFRDRVLGLNKKHIQSHQQGANEYLRLVETIGRHLTSGVGWWLCPLCSVSHTSMYLNGQTDRSSYGIHATGSYGRFLQEASMN